MLRYDKDNSQKMKKFFVAAVIALALAGCGKSDSPAHRQPSLNPGEETPVPPADPVRPGVDADNLEEELKDSTPRITGAGADMNYNDGGVLFRRNADGSVRIADLDGVSTADFIPGAVMSADSVMRGATLKINRTDVNLLSVRLLQRTSETEWYYLMSQDSTRIIIVVPAR